MLNTIYSEASFFSQRRMDIICLSKNVQFHSNKKNLTRKHIFKNNKTSFDIEQTHEVN